MALDLDQLSKRFERAKEKRANWDSVLQEIAERVWPAMSDFVSRREPGAKRTELMFDPTAALAAQKGASAIAAFVWPSNQRYQKLTTTNKDLNKLQNVKVWFDEATDLLFRARYSPRADFEAQMGATNLQHFIFGTGTIFCDDDIRRASLSYRALHLGQTWVEEGSSGQIEVLHRCWPWPLRLIEKTWPGKLPRRLAEQLQIRPDDEHDVVMSVFPRDDMDPQHVGPRGMPWVCVYWMPGSDKTVLQEGGFHEWPFGTMRFAGSPGEVYGRSPTWLVLSSIKVLNAQKRGVLAAAQKTFDPPLLAYADDVPIDQSPGAITFGGLDAAGNQLVKPLMTGARIDIGLDMMDKEREIIASAAMLDVFRVLVDHPQMTATQTMELLNERAIHLAPIGGRIESGCIGPITERELGILMRSGQLPPMPNELIEAQGEYRIEYTSPMRQAMRAGEGMSIARALEQITPWAQLDPSVMRVIKASKTARRIWDIQGAPADLLYSEDEMKEIEVNDAEAAQAAQLVQAAPALSQTAANIARMQAAGGLQPGL